MKTNSYGIFTIDVVNENNPDEKEIIRGFNSLTPAGFARLETILNGDTDEAFANYVKLGIGELADNPTDLTNPVFGYHSPNTGWDKLTRVTFTTNFLRTTVQPNNYTEIGIFWEDQETNEKVLLAYADVNIRISDGYIITSMAHSLTTRPVSDSNYIFVEGEYCPYGLSVVGGMGMLARVLQNPEYTLAITNGRDVLDRQLFGTVHTSKPNNLGEAIIRMSVTNTYSNPVSVSQISLDSGMLRNKGSHLTYGTNPVNTEAYTTDTCLQVMFERPIVLQPGKTISVDLSAMLTLTDNLATKRNPIATDYNVHNLTGISSTGPDETYRSRYTYSRNGLNNTQYQYGYGGTYYSIGVSTDVYICITSESRRTQSHRWVVGPYTDPQAITAPAMTYDPATRTITLASTVENIRSIRAYTDMPNSSFGYEAAPVNNQIVIPSDIVITGPIYAQIVDTSWKRSRLVIINRYIGTHVSQKTYPEFLPNGDLFVHGQSTSSTTLSVSKLTDAVVAENGYTHGQVLESPPSWWTYTTLPGSSVIKASDIGTANWLLVSTYSQYYVLKVSELGTIPPFPVSGPLDMSEAEDLRNTVPPVIEPNYSKISNFVGKAPCNGEMVFFTRTRNNVRKDIMVIPVTEGEEVDVYLDDVYNPHTYDEAGFVCMRVDGEESWANPLYPNSHNYLPETPNFTYSDLTNVLSGPMPRNCFKIAIKHWNVPVAEIEIEGDPIWFSAELPFIPDPFKQYQVYSVLYNGIYSTDPWILNPDAVDPIHEPIVDLSKPNEFLVSEWGTTDLPVPNFVKYGVESFAGELNGEPITRKECTQINERLWICKVCSLNWEHRFRIVKGYSNELMGSYNDEYYINQYYTYLPGQPLNGPNNYRLTMWTTWLPYAKNGFDAFIKISYNHEPIGLQTPFVSEYSYPAMTVQEQNGYFRQVLDNKLTNYYGRFTDNGIIYNHEREQLENPLYTSYLNIKLNSDTLDDVRVAINDVETTPTKILDEEDNVIGIRIATPMYVFEHDYVPGSEWKLVENNSGNPITVDTVISIRIANGIAISNYKFPYITYSDGTDIADTRYLSNAPLGGPHIYSATYNVSLSWYLRPGLGKESFGSIPEADHDYVHYKSLTLYMGSNYLNSAVPMAFLYYIDGVLADIVDWDPLTRSFRIVSGEHAVTARYGNNSNWYYFIEGENDEFVFSAASNKYTGGYLSSGVDYAILNIYFQPLSESAQIYYMYLSTSGAQGTPLVYETFPPLDTDDLEPLPYITKSQLMDKGYSPGNNWNINIWINGIEARWFDFEDHPLLGQLHNESYVLGVMIDDVLVYILYEDLGFYIITDREGVYEIQAETAEIAYSYGSSDARLNNYGDLPNVVSTHVIDPTDSYRYLARIAFKIDTSLTNEANTILPVPEPNFDEYEISEYDTSRGLMIHEDFWYNLRDYYYYEVDSYYDEEEETWVHPEWTERDEYPYYLIDTINRALTEGLYTFKINGVVADTSAIYNYNSGTFAIVFNTDDVSVMYDYSYREFTDLDGMYLQGSIIFDIIENDPIDIRGLNQKGRNNEPFRWGWNWSEYGNSTQYINGNSVSIVQLSGNWMTRNARSYLGIKPFVPPKIEIGSDETLLLPHIFETGTMVLDGNFSVLFNGDPVVSDQSDDIIPLALEEDASDDVEVEYDDDEAPTFVPHSSVVPTVELEDDGEGFDIIIKDVYGNIIYDGTGDDLETIIDNLSDDILSIKTQRGDDDIDPMPMPELA